MAYRDYGNGLGVGVTYGPFQDSPYACCVRVAGVVRQALVPVGKEHIPSVDDKAGRYLSDAAEARDPEGDANNVQLPANAFIVSARFYTEEAFEDGTVVSIGANDADGNGDDTGFVADVGNTTAGTWTVGAGAFVSASLGANPLQFSSSADNVNTGYGILIVEYIETPVV